MYLVVDLLSVRRIEAERISDPYGQMAGYAYFAYLRLGSRSCAFRFVN